MKLIRLLALLALAQTAIASDIFYRANGATSVVLRPLCVPELAGEEWGAVDFDTASLNITIIAAGPSATYTAFNYTGGDIDDGPADFSWGDPTTSAVEVDAIATGAYTGCFSLSIRDEVFAVSGATEWSISVSDGGSALMDTEFQVLDGRAVATAALAAYDPPTNAEMEARTLVAANYFDPTTDPVDVGSISGDGTAADNAEAFFDGTGYAGTNNTIPTVTTLTGHTPQTGDAFARLGAPVGASISADLQVIDGNVDDIETDTAVIGAAGAGLSAIPWNAAWDAEVQSEATDALNAYDPPTNAELTSAVANVSVDEIQATALADLFNTDSGTTYGSAVSGSVVAEIADNAGGSALTEGGIADAVWDEARSGHTTAGTFGQYVLASAEYWNGTEITTALEDSSDVATAVATELGNGSAFTEAGGTGDHLTAVPWNAAWDAQVESEVDDALGGGTGTALTAIPWNASWDAEVQSEATDALNAYDPPTDTEMDAAFAALNDLSAGEVNAEVDSAIETYHLDHLLAADYDPATPPGVSTALLNELVENDAGVARFTTNSLENAPTGGGGSADWSTGEREEIRGRLGITGDTAAGGNTPTLATQASVDGLNDLDAAGVRTAVGLASANLDTQLATIDGNVDDIETAVGALNDLDAAGVRAAVGLASANLDTQLSTIDQNVDDIEADTADMQPKLGTPAGASLAADIAALPTAAEIWQVQCEDQGGGYSCQEVMSLLLSEAIGRCTYTAGTRQFVCSDPSGAETRFTLVYGTELDGDRTSSTPSPATF